ncbi:SSI family serine proteinase inhibitor [Streptomyces carpinensis]|uniref:SSI family serine proteinase inhibitor n=1 Tax=Streptomyces carpinensis TaxID=66369 RepID=A0ABV1WL79_9ACTN|nr:SSI family serine proteinase inhibitor [Streptomyces carpinensis]
MTHFSKTTTRLRRGATAAAALLLVGALPAQVARASHRHFDQGDWLYLTVTHGDTRSGDTRGALLQCDPPRGHSHAMRACAELRSAGGDVRGIPPKDVLCSMIYAPVTVEARGQWQGRAIDYTETFANQCVMQARTGDVFALDG